MTKRFAPKITGTVLLLLITFLPVVGAQQADRAALQALVPLPRYTISQSMSLTFGMGYRVPQGYGFSWDRREFTAEIERVRQQLNHALPEERPALYRKLGELYKRGSEKAKQAFETSVSLSAGLLKQQQRLGRNGRFVAEYALALQEVGQTDEAMRQIRSAVSCAPHVWQVWAAAGHIQSDRARAMTTAKRSDASAQTAWTEARHDFDRAVKLAPNLPESYESRANFLTVRAMTLHPSVASNLTGLPDFERAVALRPHEPYALAFLAWSEYSDYGTRYYPGQSYNNFAIWKVLPQANRQRLLKIRRNIEHLTKSCSLSLCAQAYMALAWLEYEFHDVPASQAQSHVRKALQAQPDLPEAEELMMHTYAVEGEWEALAQFCAERGKRHPDVRYNLVAALADYKANHLDQTEAQIDAALNLKPDDPAANLFLAFLLLRSNDQAKLETAGRCLDAAESGLTATDISTADVKEGKEECSVLRGFSLALLGKQEEARQQFTHLLEEDKDNTAARQGLALLSK